MIAEGSIAVAVIVCVFGVLGLATAMVLCVCGPCGACRWAWSLLRLWMTVLMVTVGAGACWFAVAWLCLKAAQYSEYLRLLLASQWVTTTKGGGTLTSSMLPQMIASSFGMATFLTVLFTVLCLCRHRVCGRRGKRDGTPPPDAPPPFVTPAGAPAAVLPSTAVPMTLPPEVAMAYAYLLSNSHQQQAIRRK